VWGSGIAVIGLGIVSAACWCLLVGAFALAVPAPSAATARAAALLTPGRTVHLTQPGMPDWPIPVDRRAHDEHDRGYREGDEEAMSYAFAAFEWITVRDGQAVRIVEVDGGAVRVELLDGASAGRHGWLKPRHLTP
jgi:hypothetical protein